MRAMLRLAALCPLVFLPLVASCATSNAPGGKRHPNVIVIMTDDQGMGDLGCLGNPVLETPNIDRLAEQSARLANFYVSPVCTPTRASLMTGRYAYRTRAIDTYIGRAMMDPDEVTMAEVLHDAGYRTGIFGKWHLGDCYPMRACDQGFDQALVLRGGGLAQPSEPRENNGRYTDAILFRNGKQVQTKGYCTDVFFDAAIEFVRDNKNQPFFLYVPTNTPHTPLADVPRTLYEKYRTR
ncbi:MAG: sulfatase-like hydrolase/transferase, partial [Planctomycetes bacterium]|nr:sulfatase-like hydrolase/transferase [Planctomycetota bacterium]